MLSRVFNLRTESVSLQKPTCRPGLVGTPAGGTILRPAQRQHCMVLPISMKHESTHAGSSWRCQVSPIIHRGHQGPATKATNLMDIPPCNRQKHYPIWPGTHTTSHPPSNSPPSRQHRPCRAAEVAIYALFSSRPKCPKKLNLAGWTGHVVTPWEHTMGA